MANDVVNITDEVKEKLRDFDEQEAYFLLCEIFSYAQATKDYAKFQTDLAEWKSVIVLIYLVNNIEIK